MLKRTAAGLGAGIVLLAGCANTGESVAAHEATHEWIATDRVAAVGFHENERVCAGGADSVDGYEACMADRGYELHTP
jgi:hypothetical protein